MRKDCVDKIRQTIVSIWYKQNKYYYPREKKGYSFFNFQRARA